ncbi:NADP-dependent 3-hydroxy acid dehydrogenase YdfG [Diaminobutyricimonas aerilata]|uniref:NADP-dependent 3-hydroxy acid dehydrogenase YdfG n=1 Tax=Diaminobutyricimonas aerilata TaxID=1162967 RepID=A0A2M9CJS2_9MICO|nr:SDR family NAD(P)-dependent oxidoreductase [Diaminobutyricimonas aerilata]PJJ72142.1 NADP-dependent 3-hydroxy acid dehydrogenase YdfG [Diaminobutyricimonas aerilata]
MDLGLTGRVALVVGGSGRIGIATARQLLAEGAVVVLAARDRGRLDAAAAELGADVRVAVVDTRDAGSVDTMVRSVVEDLGRIDVLVNTAAPPAGTLDPSLDRDPAAILSAIDGKALGYLRVIEAVLPGMLERGWGRIINVSGQNALLSTSLTASARNSVASIASKVVADAAAGTGVTVNVVNPGPVADEPERDRGIGQPGGSTYVEVAAAVVYLCSEQAAAISGETLALGHRIRGQMVL